MPKRKTKIVERPEPEVKKPTSKIHLYVGGFFILIFFSIGLLTMLQTGNDSGSGIQLDTSTKTNTPTDTVQGAASQQPSCSGIYIDPIYLGAAIVGFFIFFRVRTRL